MPPLFVFLALVLADAAPPVPPGDPASYQSAGWLLLGLAGLATAGNQILGFVAKFRSMREPEPGSVSADRVKALEQRGHAVEISVATSMGAINSKFEAISQTLTNMASDWNYAVGRLDGRAETHQD